ncbi:DNA internalization-related competence protein ComEC/Rec2 [Alteromonas gilva]|uniref:DNA internalization-related competence protein ComEC/Rec2 n=1 Tax=Alteromonas gilva TaxID=2987522 RepID=A0ABT5L3F1_9ALTE|nr:DNA internalization-related competence protein ComEC/Rec2 [Alteromonas gilva]MDC8830931.1 DNA internalization-related competence protein ComEC/Rec2 [Alteromonas gilva]
MNGRIIGIAATGYCCATVSARWWPSLPSIVWQCCLLLTTGIILIACFGRHYYTSNRTPKSWWYCSAMLAGLCTGSLWAASLGQSYLTWQQLDGEIQQDVIIEGRITRYQVYPDLQRLILDNVVQDGHSWPASRQILLNDYRPDRRFKRGQWITGQVRIRPARALANPAGFDAQQWYVSQQIVKTGYVRHALQLIEPDLSLRGRLQMRLITSLMPGKKWLNALLFGDREQFSKADWGLLQRTGTAHLFAISGLHLMIVAALSLLLVRAVVLLVATTRLPLLANFRPVSVIVMLSCCGFYGYLAHWQVAVVRAFIMVAIGAALFLLARRISRMQVLIFTLALNIALTPFAVYGSALYLSIGAVGIILLYYWRWQLLVRKPVWIQCIALQFALTIGMMPLVGGLLGQVSLLSPFINILLVPVMSMLIVPGCMLGLLLSVMGPLQPFGDAVLNTTGRLLEWIMVLLAGIDERYASGTALPLGDPGYALAGVVVICLAVLPVFYGQRRLLLVAVLASSQLSSDVLWSNTPWQVHFFDVGQGSATLITRNHEALLIDTGAGYGAGNNYVERVIEPFLQAGGYTLKQVYLSHLDNDHAGGLPALQRLYPALPVFTPHNGCTQGQQHQWQALQIRVLWPPADSQRLSENDRSCVLLIGDDKHKVLLPGDIEQHAESALLAGKQALRASVLLAPHHGSNTSSSAQFIARVDPQYVVYSQGWLNRWGFPDERVRARYQHLNASEILISKSGYVRLSMGRVISTERFRNGKNAKWFHKTFSN